MVVAGLLSYARSPADGYPHHISSLDPQLAPPPSPGEKADVVVSSCCNSYVVVFRTPSSVALIVVGKHGENSLAVASGAKARLSPADIEHATTSACATPAESSRAPRRRRRSNSIKRRSLFIASSNETIRGTWTASGDKSATHLRKSH